MFYKTRIRLLIVNNSRFLTQKITGVQRFAIEISRKLQELFSEIKFISPVIKQPPLESRFNVDYTGNLSGYTWEQLELPFYLYKEKSPLLLNLANTAPACYKNQIVTIHDLACLNEKWVSYRFKLFYSALIPQITKNSLKIVTVSEFSKKELIERFGIDEKKIEVIYNAVSPDFINFVNEIPTVVYEYILAVSSLNPRKNFKNLISAYNRLKLSDVKLLIVGEENNIYKNPHLKSLIKDNPNIIFTGYLTDKELAGLYKHAKLFIFPSLYEGFGIPPIEAMACGCPTVVSNATSIPEICADASCYVDPNSIDSIANGINEVLKDESARNELINKGLQRVKAFSWQASARKYLELIKEC